MASSEGSQLRNSFKVIRSANTVSSNCRTHTNDTLILFCYQCKVPICMSCLDETHRKHDTVSMKSKADETIKQLELEYNDRSKAVAMHSNISDMVLATKKNIDILNGNKDKMIAVINSRTEQTKKMLEITLEDLKKIQTEANFLRSLKTSIDGSKATLDSCEAYKNLVKVQQSLTNRSKLQTVNPKCAVNVKELNAPTFQKMIEQIVGKSERKCDACDTDVSSQNRVILCCEAHELCMTCAEALSVLKPNGCCPICPTSAEPLDIGLHSLDHNPPKENEKCPICYDDLDGTAKVLIKCKHAFCKDCLDQAFDVKPVCPKCGEFYGQLKGTQPPDGRMTISESYTQDLPGYRGYGSITINYSFPDGTQGSEHPNPGKGYKGIRRTAYLPNNTEGREVTRLLRAAFDARIIFTIGSATTTGEEGKITWDDIHHKTSIYGGPHKFGYPDPEYLTRVQEELAAKGFQ